MQLTPFKADCPYCGERITLLIDTYSGPEQYIEDCQVCCRPINFSVIVNFEGNITLNVTDENE